MIDIEKGIPLVMNPRNVKYPWAEMEVGDSFVYLGLYPHSHASRAGKLHGRKFAVRKVEGSRFRIWRTE